MSCRSDTVRKAVEEIGDTGGDVVADEAHAFDSADAALGRFAGVASLEPGAGHWVDAASRPGVSTKSTS